MEEMSFIENFGVLIIAIIALFQPWLISLWKKYFKPGIVEFFETAKIEIGFNNSASTIGINGTLRSYNKDLYISKISLELIKEKDQSKHNFNWQVFRDTKLYLSGDKDVEVELPYGILLSTQSPQRINIQFHDTNQQDELKAQFYLLANSWLDYQEKHFPFKTRTYTQDDNLKLADLFTEFDKTKVPTDSFTKANQEFYWEKSKYELKMKIETSRPNKIFESKFNFKLEEKECKRLRQNIFILIEYVCHQKKFDWNFIYTNYEKSVHNSTS